MISPKSIWILIPSCILFLILAFSFSAPLYWDTAVYIGMGKFIFSLGDSGLWEPARPLLFPILIGALEKLSLDALLAAKILGLIFALALSFITFLLGKRLFNEKTGLIAAIVLLFSPTIFHFSTSGLTDVPSTALALLAVYFFVSKSYFLSGIFAGLASMTRFLQLFAGIIIGCFLLYGAVRKGSLKPTRSFALGFALVALPYLALNAILYGNPFYPFILQSFLTKVTGWLNYQAAYYYFKLLVLENFVSLFAIGGIFLALLKINKHKILLAAILFFYLIFFSLIPQKEPRFFITFLPYICLFSAFCLASIRFRILKTPIIYFLFLAMVIQIAPQIVKTGVSEDYGLFQDYVSRDDVNSGIWISNPAFIVNSDKKADMLIYYPTTNEEQVNRLIAEIPKAEHILINTCDIPCSPSFPDCEIAKKTFLAGLRERFYLEKHETHGECEFLIYRKIIS